MGLNIAQCYLATRPLIIPCRIDTLTGANDLTQETGIGKKISLCSKRFKSSYGAKARAEAKKKKKVLSSQLSRRTRTATLAKQARKRSRECSN